MQATITLRLPTLLLERVDKLAKKRSIEQLGVTWTRADIIREALLSLMDDHA